jgi:hypothetical protein
MGEKDVVGGMENRESLDSPQGRQNAPGMVRVGGANRNVPHHRVAVGFDEVDGANISAGSTDH